MKVDKQFVVLLLTIVFSAGMIVAKVDAANERITRIERILDGGRISVSLKEGGTK